MLTRHGASKPAKGSSLRWCHVVRLATTADGPAFRNQRGFGALERVPIRLNRERALDSLFDRIFCGKPVPTFPENALARSRRSYAPASAKPFCRRRGDRCVGATLRPGSREGARVLAFARSRTKRA